MHPVEFFKFWITAPGDTRPRLSRWKMTREEAVARDPMAKPEEWTREVRICPDDDSEAMQNLHSTGQAGNLPKIY